MNARDRAAQVLAHYLRMGVEAGGDEFGGDCHWESEGVGDDIIDAAVQKVSERILRLEGHGVTASGNLENESIDNVQPAMHNLGDDAGAPHDET